MEGSTSHKRNVVLINPPHAGSYRSAFMKGDSLALAALGQIAKEAGYQVTVLDCFLHNWSTQQVLERLPSEIAVAGITLMSANATPAAAEIARGIHKISPGAKILLGGAAPTLTPSRFSENRGFPADSVYVGSCLEPWRSLLGGESLPGCVRADAAQIGDMSALTWRPDLVYAFSLDPVVSMEASKGCYARCNFCSIYAEYDRHWLPKSESVVRDELDAVNTQVSGCTELRFVDANFFGQPLKASRQRAVSLAQEIHHRGMRFRIECRANDICESTFRAMAQNGLTGLFIGLESGSDHSLQAMQKDVSVNRSLRAINFLKDIGLSFTYGFMMMTPKSGPRDIEHNLDFLQTVGEGVRLKHLFGGLIRQEGTEFGGRSVDDADANHSLSSRLGYVPEYAICHALINCWDHLCRHYNDLLNAEHSLSLALDRGKETGACHFFMIDREYCANLIEWYRRLVAELQHSSSPLNIIEAGVEELQGIVAGQCAAVSCLSLPDSVQFRFMDHYSE